METIEKDMKVVCVCVCIEDVNDKWRDRQGWPILNSWEEAKKKKKRNS